MSDDNETPSQWSGGVAGLKGAVGYFVLLYATGLFIAVAKWLIFETKSLEGVAYLAEGVLLLVAACAAVLLMIRAVPVPRTGMARITMGVGALLLLITVEVFLNQRGMVIAGALGDIVKGDGPLGRARFVIFLLPWFLKIIADAKDG